MVQKGKVISTEGSYATVELVRNSACSSCHHKDSCGAGIIAGCGKSEIVTVKANNLCGADVGDSVVLNSDSAKTLGVAFCVFVLPLIVTFAVYLVCAKLFPGAWITVAAPIVTFFVSFFVFFFGFNKLLTDKVTINITDITDD